MMIYRKMIATGAHNHLSLNHDIDFTVQARSEFGPKQSLSRDVLGVSLH